MKHYTEREFLEIVKQCYKSNPLYQVSKEQILSLNELIKENISQIRENEKLKRTYNTTKINDTNKFIFYGYKIFYLKEQLELLLMRKQSLIKNIPKFDKLIIQQLIDLIYYDETKCYYKLTSKYLAPSKIKSFIEIFIIGNYRIKLYKDNGKKRDFKNKYNNSINTLKFFSNIINDKYLNSYLSTKTQKRIDEDFDVINVRKDNLLISLKIDLSKNLKHNIFIHISEKQKKIIDLEIKELLETIYELNFQNRKKDINTKYGLKTFI